MAKDSVRIIANNKRAYHDFFVLETFEAGIELYGTEVKSVRQGHCSVKEAYVEVDKGELFIDGMHIPPYEKGNIFNKDPLRRRRLLMHKKEILRLSGKVSEKGLTLIPLEVYFKGPRVKLRIGLCRGKKLYDKREAMTKKSQKRDIEREFKSASIHV